MLSPVPSIRDIVASLRGVYGDLTPQVTEPFEMILLENVAYLVNDRTRHDTFDRLRREIGVSAKAILAHTVEEIASAISGGGLKPLMRAEKVREAARVGNEIGPDKLNAAIAEDPKQARKMLRRFPSIGEPYADRILLFAGSQVSIAPDSNALRVLTRVGYVREEKNYAAMYRAAVAATAGLTDLASARMAHLLLRRHGQEVCKRPAPICEHCPLRTSCAWYSNATA